MSKIFITNYEVSNNMNKKILLISDLHYYDQSMTSLLNTIYKKAMELEPNYICIAGDVVDERYIFDKEVLISFLKKLSSISPVMVCIGNHELKTKNEEDDFYDKTLFDEIRNIENLHLLENETFETNDFSFTGLYFNSLSYKENKKGKRAASKIVNEHFLDGIHSDKYKIVLSHSPYILINMKKSKLYKDADLILSGHTHAGISPLIMPRLTGKVLISPAKHLFPSNSYGYLKNNKTIVSSGIVRLSHFNPFHKFNFLFKGEIVLIKF